MKKLRWEVELLRVRFREWVRIVRNGYELSGVSLVRDDLGILWSKLHIRKVSPQCEFARASRISHVSKIPCHMFHILKKEKKTHKKAVRINCLQNLISTILNKVLLVWQVSSMTTRMTIELAAISETFFTHGTQVWPFT